MGNKKLIKGLIITLVILLIIGGALAYIYFGTDLLKTDAELFAKYGGRATSALGQFLESGNTKTYYQKKQNQNYENDTKLNVNLNIGNDNPQYETILALKGAVDHDNKKAEQNIDLNYSNSQKFSFNLIKNDETYAFGSKEVVDKYVAKENSNLKDFAKKDGITDLDKIPNKIDIENYKNTLTPEQLKELRTKYLEVVKAKLSDADFSKEKGENNKYILSLSGDKVKTILMTVLEEMRSEQVMLNMLETSDNIREYQDDIDSSINELEDTDFSEFTMQISVGEDNTATVEIKEGDQKILVNLAITNSDEIAIKAEVTMPSNDITIVGSDNQSGLQTETINVKLTKQITDNECQYIANVNVGDSTIIVTLDINNMLSSNVNESYKIELLENSETQLAIELKNSITFKAVNVTELNDSNAVVFNKLKTEEIQSLVPAIIEEIQKVNQNKMEKIQEDVQNGVDGGIMSVILSYINMMQSSLDGYDNLEDYENFNYMDDSNGNYNFELTYNEIGE